MHIRRNKYIAYRLIHSSWQLDVCVVEVGKRNSKYSVYQVEGERNVKNEDCENCIALTE